MKKRILKVKDVDELTIKNRGIGIKDDRHDIYRITAYPGDFWEISHKLSEKDAVQFCVEGGLFIYSILLKRDQYLEMAKKHNLRLIKSKKPTITFNPEFNEIVNKIMEKRRLEQKGGILDKVEKEYLGAIIKPFRDKVDSITKYRGVYTHVNEEYIVIDTNCGDDITFPNFKKGTMYTGMEAGKEYTLKELGL